MNWLQENSLLLTLIILLTPAVYFDVRYFRIPNLLCLLGCLAGLLFGFAQGGNPQLIYALAGMLAAFCIGLPFWLWGWMGAGDVKLVAAVGAFVGWPLILKVLAGIAFAGFFLSLLALARKGQLGSVLYRLGATVRLTAAMRSPTYISAAENETPVRLPYAIAIAAGSLLTVWMFA